MDDPSVKWSQKRYDEIMDGVKPFIVECGYDPDNDVKYIPISGLTGENIKAHTEESSWYDGPNMLDILDQMPIPR